MDIVAAFIVGYLLGTRQGREGLERTLASLQAIAQSSVIREVSGAALTLASQRLGQRSWLLGLAGDLAKDALARLLLPRR
ncbi:MAG: hypothetical protein ACK42I_07560 [Thermomicrobium sp.]